MAKSLHPDMNPAKDAAARFARIAAAYAVLSTAHSRREYDQKLAARAGSVRPHTASDLRQGHYGWANVAGRPSGHTPDVSEIDELFDTFFGGPRRPAKPPKPARSSSDKQEPNKRKARKPRAPRRTPG